MGKYFYRLLFRVGRNKEGEIKNRLRGIERTQSKIDATWQVSGYVGITQMDRCQVGRMLRVLQDTLTGLGQGLKAHP